MRINLFVFIGLYLFLNFYIHYTLLNKNCQ
nr:MAG TPA: hypothetical protein [Bacteriophage sp.]